MQIIDLFSGIGGFSLAGHWLGWETIMFCEINTFGQKVLSYHFPGVPIYEDIKKLDYEKIRRSIDPKRPTIVVGGFPCQPYSTAGKRLGKEDDRHLWPYCIETVRELKPDYCVFENVGGLLSWNGGVVFDEVQADLEAAGYEVTPFLLPACAVNAPHRRDRIWFVAHSESDGGDRAPGKGFCEAERQKRDYIEQSKQCSEIWTTSNSSDTGTESMQHGGKDGVHGLEATSDSESVKNIRRRSGRFQPIIAGVDAKRDASNANEHNGNLSGLRTSEVSQQQASGIQGCDAADTNSNQRCEGRVHAKGGEETKRHSGSCSTWDRGGNWENFPTQSAICDRNDGFPDKLAGMSFSKWRNESIKAMGNAIVPQVAYQIFKAIQQYEDL